MPADFPLPLSGQPPESTATETDPWGRDERPEPTDLITLWPGEAAPTLAGVLEAMRPHVNGKIEVIAEPPAESCAHIVGEGKPIWAAILKFPETAGHWAIPCVVWAEPMREIGESAVKHLKAESIKWALGLETFLFAHEPTAHIVDLLRVLSRAAPETPAILDVNMSGWHERKELEELFLPTEPEITESMLFFGHAVGTDAPPKQESRLWLYTQGLDRCGLPELEMLDVPYPMLGSAMKLLTSVAELIVEEGMPDPGVRFEIGNELAVTLHPWRDVASTIDPSLPGHLNNRFAHSEHELTGVRAVICGAEPKAGSPATWTWPEGVIKQLAMYGESSLYRTARGAKRQADVAQQTLADLAAVFASVPPKLRQPGEQRTTVFLIKAGFQKLGRASAHSASGDANREHLWLEVDHFSPDAKRVEGRLVSEPNEIPHLHAGSTVKVDRSLITDWQVLTRQGIFGPGTLDSLRGAMTALQGATP